MGILSKVSATGPFFKHDFSRTYSMFYGIFSTNTEKYRWTTTRITKCEEECILKIMTLLLPHRLIYNLARCSLNRSLSGTSTSPCMMALLVLIALFTVTRVWPLSSTRTAYNFSSCWVRCELPWMEGCVGVKSPLVLIQNGGQGWYPHDLLGLIVPPTFQPSERWAATRHHSADTHTCRLYRNLLIRAPATARREKIPGQCWDIQ